MRAFTSFHGIISSLLLITQPIHALVGGTDAPKDAAPFVMPVSAKTLFGYNYICAATLIGPKTVVTTAECVDGSYASFLSVHSGSPDRTSGQALRVSKFIIHPSWNTNTRANNFAILHLDEEVTDISPALIADASPATGDKLTLYGWGTTSETTNALPKNLQQLSTSALDRPACNEQWKSTNIISFDKTCDQPADGTMACKGDTGGAVVTEDGKLAAMMTNGNGCNNPGLPDVDANVTEIEWIKGNIV